MIVRPAGPRDAEAMSKLLAEILRQRQSGRPSDPDHVRSFYIDHPDSVICPVAEDDDGSMVGFQSLKLVGAGNMFDLPAGWGAIGTYVRTGFGRHGVGAALFAATRAAAAKAGITQIDATIGADNADGLGYYEAMGFRTYRLLPGSVGKCYELDAA